MGTLWIKRICEHDQQSDDWYHVMQIRVAMIVPSDAATHTRGRHDSHYPSHTEMTSSRTSVGKLSADTDPARGFTAQGQHADAGTDLVRIDFDTIHFQGDHDAGYADTGHAPSEFCAASDEMSHDPTEFADGTDHAPSGVRANFDETDHIPTKFCVIDADDGFEPSEGFKMGFCPHCILRKLPEGFCFRDEFLEEVRRLARKRMQAHTLAWRSFWILCFARDTWMFCSARGTIVLFLARETCLTLSSMDADVFSLARETFLSLSSMDTNVLSLARDTFVFLLSRDPLMSFLARDTWIVSFSVSLGGLSFDPIELFSACRS